MAASTASEWALNGAQMKQVLVDILSLAQSTAQAPRVFITPGVCPGSIQGFRDGQTLWTAGFLMIRTADLHQPVAGHADVVAGLYEHINGILPNPLVWTNDECHLDLMRLIGGDTATERHFLRSHYGPPCLVWLPFAEIRQLVRWAAPPQLGEQGLQRNTMASGRLVSGVIQWQHIRSGRLVIRKAHKAPGDEVRRLLLALLAHHLELAYSAKSDNELRVTATPLDHPVVVTAKICQGPEPSVKLGITTAIGGDEMVALVSSTKDAVLAVSEYGADEVTVKRLHPHPALCRMVCLWMGKRRWIQSHKVYKQAALSATRRHGQQDIEGRHTAWHSDHSRIANALDQVSWVDIRQITGATGWGEQVLCRLKLRAFHGWGSTRSLRGCPIEECLQQDVLVAHTFWQCAGAIKLWDVFYAPWAAQGALSTPT